MILNTIYAFIAEHIIELLMGISITALDASLILNYYEIVDFMATNSSLVGLFIRPYTLIAGSITFITIINFEHIYKIAIWIKNRLKFN